MKGLSSRPGELRQPSVFCNLPGCFQPNVDFLRALSALGRGGARLIERFAEESRNLQCRLQVKRTTVIQLCVQPLGFCRQLLSYLGLELGSPERDEPREPNPDTHVLARSRPPRTGRRSSNDYRI